MSNEEQEKLAEGEGLASNDLLCIDNDGLPRRGGMVTGAYECPSCDGCQYAQKHSGGWCHMFKYAPDTLPCTQHDKFEGERKAMSAMIRKKPEILTMMVLSQMEDLA